MVLVFISINEGRFVTRNRCCFDAFSMLFHDFRKLWVCMAVKIRVVTALIKVRSLKPRKSTSTDEQRRERTRYGTFVMGSRRFRSIFCGPNYVLPVWIACVSRSHCTAGLVYVHVYASDHRYPLAWNAKQYPMEK